MYKFDPSRRDLALEFKANPYGRHSAELQRILNLFRLQPMAGNYVLIETVPYREWALARFGATSRDPVEKLGPVFAKIEEAEWAVFKLRWCDHSGQELDID